MFWSGTTIKYQQKMGKNVTCFEAGNRQKKTEQKEEESRSSFMGSIC